MQQQMTTSNGNPDKQDGENIEHKANDSHATSAIDGIDANKLMLQINADKHANAPTSANNEILQQLYNYSQMSGELIK